MDERTNAIRPGQLASAIRHLGDQALDGMIAASNGLNNFLESNAVYVFSGVRPIRPLNAMTLTPALERRTIPPGTSMAVVQRRLRALRLVLGAQCPRTIRPDDWRSMKIATMPGSERL